MSSSVAGELVSTYTHYYRQTKLIYSGEAQDCNDLVTITSSDAVVLVNTSISRSCLQCVDGSMVFDSATTVWMINWDTVSYSTPGVEEVAGVLVLLDPMQLLMDGGVTLECVGIYVEYTNIQVFSSSEAPLCEELITTLFPHSSPPTCGHISC